MLLCELSTICIYVIVRWNSFEIKNLNVYYEKQVIQISFYDYFVLFCDITDLTQTYLIERHQIVFLRLELHYTVADWISGINKQQGALLRYVFLVTVPSNSMLNSKIFLILLYLWLKSRWLKVLYTILFLTSIGIIFLSIRIFKCDLFKRLLNLKKSPILL